MGETKAKADRKTVRENKDGKKEGQLKGQAGERKVAPPSSY